MSRTLFQQTTCPCPCHYRHNAAQTQAPTSPRQLHRTTPLCPPLTLSCPPAGVSLHWYLSRGPPPAAVGLRREPHGSNHGVAAADYGRGDGVSYCSLSCSLQTRSSDVDILGSPSPPSIPLSRTSSSSGNSGSSRLLTTRDSKRSTTSRLLTRR